MSKNHRPIEIGEKVFVYRNLNRQCLSIKSMKSKLVIAHVQGIQLDDVKLKVSAKVRDKVRREGKKYVHAGAVGFVKGFDIPDTNCQRVTYNPYVNDTFVDTAGAPVFSAPEAYVGTSGVWI